MKRIIISLPIIFFHSLAFGQSVFSEEKCFGPLSRPKIILENNATMAKICVTSKNTWAEFDIYNVTNEYETPPTRLESVDSQSINKVSCRKLKDVSKIELVAACLLDSRPGCTKEPVCVRITLQR